MPWKEPITAFSAIFMVMFDSCKDGWQEKALRIRKATTSFKAKLVDAETEGFSFKLSR
jgi:hypothetical protein